MSWSESAYRRKHVFTHKNDADSAIGLVCIAILSSLYTAKVKIINLLVSAVARIQQLVGCSGYIHLMP